jgi:hypothetical protein
MYGCQSSPFTRNANLLYSPFSCIFKNNRTFTHLILSFRAKLLWIPGTGNARGFLVLRNPQRGMTCGFPVPRNSERVWVCRSQGRNPKLTPLSECPNSVISISEFDQNLRARFPSINVQSLPRKFRNCYACRCEPPSERVFKKLNFLQKFSLAMLLLRYAKTFRPRLFTSIE